MSSVEEQNKAATEARHKADEAEKAYNRAAVAQRAEAAELQRRIEEAHRQASEHQSGERRGGDLALGKHEHAHSAVDPHDEHDEHKAEPKKK